MKQRNNKKEILRLIVGILCIALFLVTTVQFLVPFGWGLLRIFLSLARLYFSVDVEAKFFGGFVFLFIFWKLFERVINVLIKLVEVGWELIRESAHNIAYTNKKQKNVRRKMQ